VASAASTAASAAAESGNRRRFVKTRARSIAALSRYALDTTHRAFTRTWQTWRARATSEQMTVFL
jgi:hypothetical protein